MIIGGLQKLTLLDYPSKVACTVFTYGCNYRCPFCHNAALVEGTPETTYTESEILSFLKKRIGVLDGVCITGGEPLMQSGIENFMSEIKSLGYSLKLDTNGSFPEKLRFVAENGLVDYVAMDVKNSPQKYALTTGVNADVSKISESINFLKTGKVDYEFRTTIVDGHHDEESMEAIAEWISGAKRYFLQNFVDSGMLIGNAQGVPEEKMRKFLDIVQKRVPTAEIRGL